MARSFRTRLADPVLLKRAWKLLRRGGRAAGVDGVSLGEFEEQLETRLARLAKRLEGGPYQPGRLRPALIAKPFGGRRKLSIPNVEDRLVQQAARLLIESRLEERFHDSSYAYRPRRGVHQATERIVDAVGTGAVWVVETDIRSYFDSIRHDHLCRLLAEWNIERDAVELVRRVVRRGYGVWPRKRGLPQGSPLSPLLANAYLTPVDEALDSEGYTLVRYADDLVILGQDRSCVERGLSLLKRRLRERGLKIHPGKTRVLDAREESFEFLGFLHAPDFLWPSPDNIRKFEREIAYWTSSVRSYGLGDRQQRVEELMRAFAYYYHVCDVSGLFRKLDRWIQDRLNRLSANEDSADSDPSLYGSELPRLSDLRRSYLRRHRTRPVRWNGYEAAGLRRRHPR